MDTILLSRIQFALTVMFHYLFPPLTIGLGAVLVYLGWRHLHTGQEIYRTAQRFWTGIFALNFAVGVASGIVMEFQFGTNWANYSRYVGDVFGSALAAEGIFAFFLESGFLAILVFGWDRVSKRMHFFATCMVALGSIFSSVWIVVANSWQQTPAGYHVVPVLRNGAPWLIDGRPLLRAEITDFWAVVFSPSSMDRLAHVLIGCFIMGGFLVMSISAWYLLRGRHLEFARRSFRGGLLFATVFSLAALASGHSQARGVYHNQPAKMAAFEGQFATGRGDLTLFGFPDEKESRMAGAVSIPGGLSFLLFNDTSRTVMGLDRFRPEDRPPLLLPFFTYHVMIGLGFLFIALTLGACFCLWRGTLFEMRWLLWVFVVAVVPAVLANLAGWCAAEVGRQPWVVQPPVAWDGGGNLVVGPDGFVDYPPNTGMRTRDGVSQLVTANQVLGSIIGFGLLYTLLGALWVYVLNQKIQRGPERPAAEPGGGGFLGPAVAMAERQQHMINSH